MLWDRGISVFARRCVAQFGGEGGEAESCWISSFRALLEGRQLGVGARHGAVGEGLLGRCRGRKSLTASVSRGLREVFFT